MSASRRFIEPLEGRTLLSGATPAPAPADTDPAALPAAEEETWVEYVPTEHQTQIELFQHEGRVTAVVRIVFNNAGYRVTDWGTPQRDGNHFIVNAKVERWTGASPEVITPMSHEYALGELPEGQYAFDFHAWGKPVESRAFTVPVDDTDHTWVPYTPTAEQTTIDILQREGRTIARVKIVFPHSGFRVEWGMATREGNAFRASAAVDQWTGPSPAILTPTVHEYVLGELPPGEYTFTFAARHETVESRSFVVDDGPVWEPYQPTPEQTGIEIFQAEGRWKARVTLSFSHNGFRVADWGTLHRDGNAFFVDAKVERTAGLLPVVTTFSNVYDLGALTGGEYAFNFSAWGHLVERKAFAVAGDPTLEWEPYTPTAEQTEIQVLQLEGKSIARVSITFPDAGYRMHWGTLTHDGNIFRANAEVDRYLGPSPAVITTLSHDYALGALAPGEYRFDFLARGKLIESRAFAVPAHDDLVLNGVEADDEYRFFTDASGENILLFWNNDPSMRPGPLVIPRDAHDRFIVNTLGGADTVIIDLVEHTPLPAHGMVYDGGAGGDVLQIRNALADDKIVIQGDRVTINGTPIHLVNVEKITVDRTSGSDVTVGGGDEVELETGQNVGTLTLAEDATVRLVGDAEQVTLSGLSISDDALLDVRDKTVLITVDSSQAQALLAELHDLVAAGRQANWNGTRGITSSLASADAANRYGVAVSIIPPPLLAVPAASVEVIAIRYTLAGDLNLDGVVNADDYHRIDSGFLAGAQTYSEGDANYDGRVNADDYFIVDSTFLSQGDAAAASAPAAATSATRFSRQRISDDASATSRKRRRGMRRAFDFA